MWQYRTGRLIPCDSFVEVRDNLEGAYMRKNITGKGKKTALFKMQEVQNMSGVATQFGLNLGSVL